MPDIAGRVHDESKEITDEVVRRTKESRRNPIYDTTGTGIFPNFIQDLKTARYNVKLVYVHVPLDTSKTRVAKRQEKTGPEMGSTSAHVTRR